MNSKSLLFSAITIIIGGMVLATSTAQAYRGDPSIKGPDCDANRHEAMEQAFENNDYEAWKELMSGKGRVTQIITAENFSRFAEAHQLAESGDLDGANAIREELGLGTGSQYRNGSGQKTNSQGTGRQGWSNQ